MSMFKQFRNKKSEESPLQVLKAYIILDKSYSRKRNEMELSMILSCNHISKAFGTDEILSEVSFHIEDQEKAAIVGINGAGKSTLLKIIVGELSADSGEVVLAKGKTLGYLAQHQDLDSSRTIYEELKEVKQPIIDMEQQIRELELNMQNASGEALEQMLAAYSRLSHTFELENGYAWKSELTGVLKGLGFTEDEFDKTVSTLSGGQKTRVSLGKLLLSRPDIILLDEPTNHLDMESIAWLETYLLNYNGAVIIVAHDRYFLNRVVTKVVELEQGHACVYLGNYTAYSEKKAMIRAAQMKAWLNQQQEIRHQEEVITKLKSFNREKSIKRAESREKMLSKIQVLDKPAEIQDEMRISLEPNIVSGNDVLTIRDLSKSFGSTHLFSHVDMEVKRGERVAIIGNNGTGKTTILKIINGMLPADTGTITLGSKVHIGYYDQEHHVLHMEKTVFEEVQDAYPNLTNTQVRNILAAFLFTGDDVFKRISDLSGGERGRVSLAKLMLSEANFLILDEPTNHLDIISKEILENALKHYTGTVLYVSHDRYFINRTAHRILDLTEGQFVNYVGNYDYYLEKHDTVMAAIEASVPQSADADNTVAAKVAESEVKLDWKAQKEEQARLRKKENDLKKCEEQIARLEARVSEIDTEMSDPAIGTQVAKLQELTKEQTACQEQLEKLYEQWEELAE